MILEPFAIAPSLLFLRQLVTSLALRFNPSTELTYVTSTEIEVVPISGDLKVLPPFRMSTELTSNPASRKVTAIIAKTSSATLRPVAVTSTKRLRVFSSTFVTSPLIIGGRDSKLPDLSTITGYLSTCPNIRPNCLPAAVSSRTCLIVVGEDSPSGTNEKLGSATV